MKKALALLLFLAMTLAGVSLAEIEGSFTEGSYVIRIPVSGDDPGCWTASDPVQDPGILTLAYARTADGVFEARYDAAGDGTMTVAVRHFTGPVPLDDKLF